MKKSLAVIFILGLIFTLFAGCTDTNGTSDNSTDSDGISFSNVIVSASASLTNVYGEVKNDSSKACSFSLKVSFYDADNKLLGTATGAVNELNGGETSIFSAIASGDYSNAASNKVQVDTMVKTEDNKPKIIEFSNIVVNKSEFMTTISGEAKNTDSSQHSFSLTVGAYDSAGKLIGAATGAVNDLAAGDTKTFSAITTTDLSSANTYKAFVTTMVK